MRGAVAGKRRTEVLDGFGHQGLRMIRATCLDHPRRLRHIQKRLFVFGFLFHRGRCGYGGRRGGQRRHRRRVQARTRAEQWLAQGRTLG